jgi:hypothetical protein
MAAVRTPAELADELAFGRTEPYENATLTLAMVDAQAHLTLTANRRTYEPHGSESR